MNDFRKKVIKDTSDKKKNNYALDIGKCIKVKDSLKTFQIIGINERKKICWIREWPLNFKSYKTFELATNKIILSTFCQLSEDNF
tara:strand:- start:1480 stop:1734 length:255 start_codon:yes stop_codon:yes gene_type:complete